MKNWVVTCAALAASAVLFVANGASAATITYVFTGTGSGTLDGEPHLMVASQLRWFRTPRT